MALCLPDNLCPAYRFFQASFLSSAFCHHKFLLLRFFHFLHFFSSLSDPVLKQSHFSYGNHKYKILPDNPVHFQTSLSNHCMASCFPFILFIQTYFSVVDQSIHRSACCLFSFSLLHSFRQSMLLSHLPDTQSNPVSDLQTQTF